MDRDREKFWFVRDTSKGIREKRHEIGLAAVLAMWSCRGFFLFSGYTVIIQWSLLLPQHVSIFLILLLSFAVQACFDDFS